MIAVIQVLRLKNVSSVCIPNSVLARNPPSRAPAIPMTVAGISPVFLPVRCSAMRPATAPSTIQAITPMMLSSLVGRCPDKRATHSAAFPHRLIHKREPMWSPFQNPAPNIQPPDRPAAYRHAFPRGVAHNQA